jgi:hypothetical protein
VSDEKKLIEIVITDPDGLTWLYSLEVKDGVPHHCYRLAAQSLLGDVGRKLDTILDAIRRPT